MNGITTTCTQGMTTMVDRRTLRPVRPPVRRRRREPAPRRCLDCEAPVLIDRERNLVIDDTPRWRGRDRVHTC